MDAFHHEVLVIGGNQEVSTTVYRLLPLGFDALLLEKMHHPWFFMGDLLLPASLPWDDMGARAADCRHTCLTKPARKALAEFERVALLGPKHVSWCAHRMTNPVAREVFMGPRNVLRAQAALLLLLADNQHGKAAIWNPLRFFKAVHGVNSVRQMPKAFRALRKCRHSIRPMAHGV